MGRARKPNAEERRHWDRVVQLGCIICRSPAGIHHCGTGAGGRKDHMKVLPLCWYHHQGPAGIDGREYGVSKRKWQEMHGTEEQLMKKVAEEIGMP